MVINQGDVYWVDPGQPIGSGRGFLHPHVVIQNNVFNRSGIRTLVICAITSNLKHAQAPGNVLLAKGEANLPKQSVVNISQLFTVDRSQFGARIGTLSRERMREILDGIRLLLQPREPE